MEINNIKNIEFNLDRREYPLSLNNTSFLLEEELFKEEEISVQPYCLIVYDNLTSYNLNDKSYTIDIIC